MSSESKRHRGQGIVRAGDLFDKYRKTLRAPQRSVVSAFIDAVEKTLNHTVDSELCTYAPKTKTLAVRTRGILKEEIRKEKRHILNYMREKLGERSTPTDIV